MGRAIWMRSDTMEPQKRTRPLAVRPVIVTDLDGTLCDTRHREHTLPNWARFHALCGLDPPLKTVRLLQELARMEDADIVVVSGRPQTVLRETKRWLARHKLACSAVLLRPRGIRMATPEWKARVITRLSQTRDVLAVLDDSEAVAHALARAIPPTLLLKPQDDTIVEWALRLGPQQK